MNSVEFIFDFGSPNAYLAHRVIPAIEQRTGIRFSYTPCLLGGIFKATGNKPPMVAYGEIKPKMDYEMLEIERFIAKHRIQNFAFNPHFPVNTLLLMRCAVVAKEDGILANYVEASMCAMWESKKKMDDPDVFIAEMNAAGLDAENLLERAQSPEIKTRLAENTSTAVERGVFGIPTFFVGKDMYFGKDRLDQVEEAIRDA